MIKINHRQLDTRSNGNSKSQAIETPRAIHLIQYKAYKNKPNDHSYTDEAPILLHSKQIRIESRLNIQDPSKGFGKPNKMRRQCNE